MLLDLRPHPSHRVLYNLYGNRLLKDRKRLMAGPEVEHVALTKTPQRTALERLTTVPFLFRQRDVRVRHVERPIIHLGLRNIETVGQSVRDRMCPCEQPQVAWLA